MEDVPFFFVSLDTVSESVCSDAGLQFYSSCLDRLGWHRLSAEEKCFPLDAHAPLIVQKRGCRTGSNTDLHEEGSDKHILSRLHEGISGANTI